MEYTLWQDEHGRELPPKSPPTTRLSTIETWSSKYKWQKRLDEWRTYLQIEREQQNERDRIDARAKRKSLLDSAIEKLEDAIEKANLQNDVPQFRAMIYGLKNVMVLSMQHHNDLPVERKDLTTKDKAINVSFVTTPVSEDKVRNRLEELGLADFVDDQTE